MEVETDKAVFPVEANGKGSIHIGPFQRRRGAAGADRGGDHRQAGGQVCRRNCQQARCEEENCLSLDIWYSKPSARAQPLQPQEKTFISPRARKLAAAKNVDLAKVTPTGGGGVRMAERDVHGLSRPGRSDRR